MDATETQNKKEQQSLFFVKNYLRFAASTVAFHRHLLPRSPPHQSVFVEKKVFGVPVMDIDAVDDDGNVKNRDASKITDWLERGVFPGIHDRSVRALAIVVLSENQCARNVLETFHFKVGYHGHLDGDGGMFGGYDHTTPLSKQLSEAMRSFVSHCGNTESRTVDNEHRRSMSFVLEYTERAPKGIHPDYFVPEFDIDPLDERRLSIKKREGALLASDQEELDHFSQSAKDGHHNRLGQLSATAAGSQSLTTELGGDDTNCCRDSLKIPIGRFETAFHTIETSFTHDFCSDDSMIAKQLFGEEMATWEEGEKAPGCDNKLSTKHKRPQHEDAASFTHFQGKARKRIFSELSPAPLTPKRSPRRRSPGSLSEAPTLLASECQTSATPVRT